MTWRARDSVAPLRWSSGGWMPARMRRLSAGVGRRHPLTIRKVSLMAGSIMRIWALRHQTDVQYYAFECTRARVAVHRAVAPAPQPEPSSRFRSATHDDSFLWSNSRCRRYVGDLSNVTPKYLDSEQKGRDALLKWSFSSRLVSLLLRWKTADTVFVLLSFSFQVWRYSRCDVLGQHPLPANLHQHAWWLDRHHMHIFWRRWLAGQRYWCWG